MLACLCLQIDRERPANTHTADSCLQQTLARKVCKVCKHKCVCVCVSTTETQSEDTVHSELRLAVAAFAASAETVCFLFSWKKGKHTDHSGATTKNKWSEVVDTKSCMLFITEADDHNCSNQNEVKWQSSQLINIQQG